MFLCGTRMEQLSTHMEQQYEVIFRTTIVNSESCIKIREAKAQHIRLLKLSIRHQISSQPKLTRSLPALTPGFYYRRVFPQWLLLGYSSLQPNSNRDPHASLVHTVPQRIHMVKRVNPRLMTQ